MWMTASKELVCFLTRAGGGVTGAVGRDGFPKIEKRKPLPFLRISEAKSGEIEWLGCTIGPAWRAGAAGAW